MSAYEPGTVAVATVRGVPNVRVWRTPFNNWLSERSIRTETAHVDRHVTDVRPLVVLDLDYIRFESFGLPKVLEVLRADYRTRSLADQIEAQVKPPRIPEPTGFAPVVEAGVKQHDMRLHWSRNEQGFWFCKDEGEYARNWGELVDPVLIRDGVEDQS